ncbi:MAG TPA: DUF2079 domain-containing protein [Acidimicrobiales bacterium]|nr:DUF2079 domain-containing protein [Acidimicrobiales bacterium]
MSTRPPPSWRRRFESQWLRWGARLENEWTDQWFPWIAGTVLFFLYFTLAEARVRSLDVGADLAAAAQGAWLIAHGHAPDLTVTGSNLLAQHLPVGMYPIGWLTTVLPTIPTLLALQAAGLAYGVVPLWRIARRVADLRAGAALALIVAYGVSPTINNLNLADFHPTAVAVAPLLAATYTALRKQWGYFFLWSLATVIWSAELGLVIAGIGVLVFVLGERGPGTLIVVFGLAWAVVAVLVLEPRFGSTGFIAPGAFRAYGSNAFSITGGMLIHPNRVLGDLLDEDNIRLIVGLLAPLLFLPVLAPRFLIPAMGLTALFLVADVDVRGNGTHEFGLTLTVFAFVAAAFALNRMGRISIDKILVDRRVLIALSVAAIGFFCIDAVNSPYERPWKWGRQDASDQARHDAVELIGATASVRASPEILPLVAERRDVYSLSDRPDPAVATRDVSKVILDEAEVEQWSEAEWHRFGAGMAVRKFVLVSDHDGVRVYIRLSG